MPQLGQCVAGISPLRALFDPRLFYVGFVVDDVLLLLVARTFLALFQDFADEQFDTVNILIACD
jgi:hypothetical protein